MPDLTLYVDVNTRTFVQSETSAQPLRSLDVILGQRLQVNVEFLEETGNGLAPYYDLDPTNFAASFALGYVNPLGASQLLAFAAATAFSPTGISGISAQTALTFQLSLTALVAQSALTGLHSLPIWSEIAWNTSGQTASTALVNKAQVQGTFAAGYLDLGLTPPS